NRDSGRHWSRRARRLRRVRKQDRRARRSAANAIFGRYSSTSRQSAETKRAASPGGTVRYSIAACSPVNIRQRPRRQLQKLAAIHSRADKCGRIGQREQNMWKQAEGTLAPDSRHIVAFPSSNTTFRAADSH